MMLPVLGGISGSYRTMSNIAFAWITLPRLFASCFPSNYPVRGSAASRPPCAPALRAFVRWAHVKCVHHTVLTLDEEGGSPPLGYGGDLAPLLGGLRNHAQVRLRGLPAAGEFLFRFGV